MSDKKRRSWLWPLAALVLFAVAAWLMTRGEPESQADAKPRVELPKRMTAQEHQRMTARRTLPAAVPSSSAPNAPPRPRDPVLAALARTPGQTTVVVEANAITNSPIGDLLLACARRGRKDPFEEIKKDTGVDVLRDLDRVAVSGKTVLLSGQFASARWDELAKDGEKVAYGDQGSIYRETKRGEDGKADDLYLARWGDQMMLVGESEDDLKASIDRIEGRTSSEPALAESEAYGEVYGVLGTDLIEQMLGRDQPELAQQLKEAAQNIELHVSAMGDVGMTAKVDGTDPQKVTDLAKTLGGALSLARLKAKADGEDELAELLDYARVSPGGSDFSMELALPMAFLEKHLAFCRQPPDAPDAGP